MSLARSLPVMTRQSEQRRLMYCHISSVNSGFARTCANTLVSGVTELITRLYVASEIPRLSARGRKLSTQRLKPAGPGAGRRAEGEACRGAEKTRAAA